MEGLLVFAVLNLLLCVMGLFAGYFGGVARFNEEGGERYEFTLGDGLIVKISTGLCWLLCISFFVWGVWHYSDHLTLLNILLGYVISWLIVGFGAIYFVCNEFTLREGDVMSFKDRDVMTNTVVLLIGTTLAPLAGGFVWGYEHTADRVVANLTNKGIF